MLRLIAAALLLFASLPLQAEDGLFLELGAGHDLKIDEGRNPQSVIRLRYEVERRDWWPDVLEYSHHSSVQNGKPFNDRPEDLVDQFSVIWRFKLK